MVETTKPEQKTKKSSKKAAEAALRKIKKKIQQAIGVISRAEQLELSQFCSKTPTKNLLIAHFGNGDENDQTTVLNACQ